MENNLTASQIGLIKNRKGREMTLEETILSFIEQMEENGVDFKEEVGRIDISLPDRDDLHIEVYVVDKEVHEIFNQYKEVSNDTM